MAKRRSVQSGDWVRRKAGSMMGKHRRQGQAYAITFYSSKLRKKHKRAFLKIEIEGGNWSER